MKYVIKWLLVLLLPVYAASSSAAEDYMEGVEYLTLANPQPTASKDHIEVVELFWYGCPHCYYLEPFLKEWSTGLADDVEFIRLPAILGPGWELLSKAWFTAELLGVTETIHGPLFEEIHVRKNRINTEADLRKFFVQHGVKAEDFDKAFSSFAVAVKVNNARLMTRRYAITGVPTIIINGKYSTSATLAGGNPELIKVVDYLVEQERQLATATPAAPSGLTISQ
jgi:thiol:disulfide interchange protein DsbA